LQGCVVADLVSVQEARERFKRPNVEAPLIVWEYAMALERWVVNAEERAERAVAEAATLREAAERMHREYIKASFHPDANDERGRWHRADRAAGALRAVLVAGREPT
jgi:hypothetical protein